ncbi:5-formyltetrahydrofolate cyclo-ligase [Psychrobacillus glaciei]|uniref:5-formyltetrahydrofolate cyclo-ligase n=1 Tax=Psychrobacillus glaciei TaxID=2283160 RepID=A0A5J6ST79_9BACI|nr:5-formyltetrahydrofolate cyclo-ligase [Psychrobacillus glaciei]QFF99437.1 5-formyltetrahydrofolate cyclo-ligase [Psychrobacillus glaciei]
MTKKEVRDEMKTRLATLDNKLYHTYSEQIKNRFLIEEDVNQASTIGLTISAFPEVDTEGIIKKLWEIGKTVVVPKCNPKDRTMTFYKLESFKQLETVYMQLLEPNPLLTTSVYPNNIDLLVVPGIVYEPTGYRIGYGGGYYDRFLSAYYGQTISLAFDFQVCEAVERGNFDLPVNKIITNCQIIPCQLNREEV